MGETYFGYLAANNPRLIEQLRSGAVVKEKTLAKATKFMDEFPKGAKRPEALKFGRRKK